jgi:hypothetical protein
VCSNIKNLLIPLSHDYTTALHFKIVSTAGYCFPLSFTATTLQEVVEAETADP